MVYPPRIGRRRNLRTRLERSNKHVNWRRQEEDHKQNQEKVRPEQRSASAARNATIPSKASGTRGSVARCDGYAHASFPRRRTLRRMKNAAIASIGAMNNDTEAPRGMSLPQIANVNAQVANTWV